MMWCNVYHSDIVGQIVGTPHRTREEAMFARKWGCAYRLRVRLK